MRSINLIIVILLLVFHGDIGLCDSGRDWWQTTNFYQIYPRSFQDSDGDGIGDLKGITSRLEYLKDTGIGATWLSPIFESPMVDFGYDIADYKAIQPEYGTLQDFDNLMAKAKELGIKILLDFVPNHTSDQSEWFQKSVKRLEGYEDYYVWHDGIADPQNPDGQKLPPNNWVSVFYGPAWTFNTERGQFYLHQFTKEQPDLNFKNPRVAEEMKDVMRFWLGRGVDGFRIDAVNHLFEVEDLRDEPKSGITDDPNSYDYTHHYYTKDLPECYETIYEWRKLLDDWQQEHGGDTRIMMTEAYANLTFTMKYYSSEDGTRRGSHIPFNFLLISELSETSTAQDFVHAINEWLTMMPLGETANWVIGNHDRSRVGSRFGAERIDAMNILLMTLPGVAVTYNGEEIGMLDNPDISWEETKDPAALNTDKSVFRQFSRDPVRTPFQWDASNQAGFSGAAQTWLPVNDNYKTVNLAEQKSSDRSHYKLFKTLIELRKAKTFQEGNIQIVAATKNVLAYTRMLEGHDTYVVIINLGPDIETLNLRTHFQLADKLKIIATDTQSNHTVGALLDVRQITLRRFECFLCVEVPQSKRFFEQHGMSVTITSSLIALALILLNLFYISFSSCRWECKS